MTNRSNIYQNQAGKYELLISKQPSFYETIDGIKSVEGLDIIKVFFGKELAHQVVQEHRVKLPECAGVWSLHN